MDDLISIIVPVYNTEKYLKRCIESLIHQTYSNLEIILINDGSKDHSKEICLEFSKKDKRIHYLEQTNQGAASARNFGIKQAKGAYIGFVDSDDVISLDMFSTLYHNLVTYQADLSICEVVRFQKETSFTNSNHIAIYDVKEALQVLLEDKKICSYSVNKLCKKELLQNVQYPIGKLQEDVGTVYQFITNAKKIVYSDSKLYGYYTRENSVTTSISEKFIYDYFEMIEKRAKDLKKYNIDEDITLNRVNVILGMFIDLSQNKHLLKNQQLKQFINQKYQELKKLNTTSIQKRNTKKHNLLIRILLWNRRIFYIIMPLYLKLKEKMKKS